MKWPSNLEHNQTYWVLGTNWMFQCFDMMRQPFSFTTHLLPCFFFFFSLVLFRFYSHHMSTFVACDTHWKAEANPSEGNFTHEPVSFFKCRHEFNVCCYISILCASAAYPRFHSMEVTVGISLVLLIVTTVLLEWFESNHANVEHFTEYRNPRRLIHRNVTHSYWNWGFVTNQNEHNSIGIE